MSTRTPQMDPDPQLDRPVSGPSTDQRLVELARTGSDEAWNELLSRHRDALAGVVGRVRGRRARRDSAWLDEVRDAFVADRDAANDPDTSGRPPSDDVRSFRPRSIAALTGGHYGPDPVGSEAPAEDRSDRDDERFLAAAFAEAPEAWQSVLWLRHVDQMSLVDLSPLVGRSADDVGELLDIAERGVVEGFLSGYAHERHLNGADTAIVRSLGARSRDTLAPHEARRLAAHLDSVDDPGDARALVPADTRRLLAVVSDVAGRLPYAVVPGITGLDVSTYRRAIGAPILVGTADADDRRRRFAVIGALAAAVLLVGGLALVLSRSNGDETLSAGSLSGSTAAADDDADDDGRDDASNEDPVLQTDSESAAETRGPDELDLRPDRSVAEHLIELVVADADALPPAEGEPADVAAVSTTVAAAAPVFAGGTGTLDITIGNDGPVEFVGTVDVVLPRGVILDGVAGGDAVCKDPDDSYPSCQLVIAPGATTDASLRIALESVIVGDLGVVGDTMAEPFVTPIAVTRDLLHNSVGRGDVSVVGNTIMQCAPAEAALAGIDCAEVHAGTGDVVDRWDVPIEFTGVFPEFGLVNSAKATLDAPAEATVLWAHLFWSGDLEEAGETAPVDSESSVLLVAPDGTAVDVVADETSFGEEDASQYASRADVTESIANGGFGEWLVGNVSSVEAQGSYGAWALVVVTDDSTSPRRHRMVTDPFDWVAPDGGFTYGALLPVPVVEAGVARLDVVGFEGERGFEPETLLVGGERLGGENPFDSSVVGEREPSFDNSLGVDIDVYDLVIDTPDATLDIDATSDFDGIRLAVLGLTVDLPG